MAHRYKGEQKLVQKLFLSSSVDIHLLRVELASPRGWSINVFHLERDEREVQNRLGLVLTSQNPPAQICRRSLGARITSL